jgi:hypothetical protein
MQPHQSNAGSERDVGQLVRELEDVRAQFDAAQEDNRAWQERYRGRGELLHAYFDMIRALLEESRRMDTVVRNLLEQVKSPSETSLSPQGNALVQEATSLLQAAEERFAVLSEEAITLHEVDQLSRYRQLVEKKHAEGLDSTEIREMEQLDTELQEQDNAFYLPIIMKLRAIRGDNAQASA